MEKAFGIKEKGKISLGCNKQKQIPFEEIWEVLYLNIWFVETDCRRNINGSFPAFF